MPLRFRCVRLAVGGVSPLRPLPLQQLVAVSLGLCLPASRSVSPWVCVYRPPFFSRDAGCSLSPFASKGGIPGVWNLCDHFGSPFFAYVSGCVDVNPRPLSLRTLWYPFLRMTVTSMFYDYAGVCCLGSTLVYCQSFSHLFRLNGIIKQPTNLNQTWPFLINVIWS